MHIYRSQHATSLGQVPVNDNPTRKVNGTVTPLRARRFDFVYAFIEHLRR